MIPHVKGRPELIILDDPRSLHTVETLEAAQILALRPGRGARTVDAEAPLTHALEQLAEGLEALCERYREAREAKKDAPPWRYAEEIGGLEELSEELRRAELPPATDLRRPQPPTVDQVQGEAPIADPHRWATLIRLIAAIQAGEALTDWRLTAHPEQGAALELRRWRELPEGARILFLDATAALERARYEAAAAHYGRRAVLIEIPVA